MKLTLKEMNGLLNGKCLPSDLIVGETLAEYLVRKFTELEKNLADSQREFRAADATIENLQMQLDKLAAENAGLKAFGDKLYSMYKGLETSGGGFHDEQSIPYQQAALDAAISAFEEIKTPATGAFLAEVRAQGVEMFADELLCPDLDITIREFAEQLRKGVQS